MDKKYAEQIEKHNYELKKKAAKSSLIGNIKLLLFLLFIAGIVFVFLYEDDFVFIISTVSLFIALVTLWIYHLKIISQLHYHKGLIRINEKYLHRISGEWVNFSDTGDEFIDENHDYAADLDIIGTKSLFQLLNTTNTYHGRNRFASDLLKQKLSRDEISRRQSAIDELSKDIVFCNDLQYYSSKAGVKEEILNLLNIIKDDKRMFRSKILHYFLHYIPIASSLFIFSAFLFSIQFLKTIAIAVILLQLTTWGLGIKKILDYIGPVGKIAYNLDVYSSVYDLIQKRDFQCEKLNEIKEALITNDTSAAKAISELNSIVQRINIRYNSVIYFVLNGLLLWDYECAYLLYNWKLKYGMHSEKWFEALGELESLQSFANLSNINNAVAFPHVTEKSHTFDAVLMGHPLITESSRVYNDFHATENVYIISGSNMSGKTTFMRTVGINIILAQAGACVCAKSLICSQFAPVSSMRIADDLGNGVSTFYAELKKIKNILDKAKSNPNTFFFIDEIFRGTNSNDRLLGAMKVIRKLNDSGVMGLTTTHDLELCNIANDSQISNISFTEEYKNGKISFDYKLKKGISTVTNAKYLMEMLGIV